MAFRMEWYLPVYTGRSRLAKAVPVYKLKSILKAIENKLHYTSYGE